MMLACHEPGYPVLRSENVPQIKKSYVFHCPRPGCGLPLRLQQLHALFLEAKGVPVKTLKPSAEDVAAAEKAHQEQEKDIAAMASVTGNNSFTEKGGCRSTCSAPATC